MTWLDSFKKCCAFGMKPLIGGNDLQSYMVREIDTDGAPFIGNLRCFISL